MWRSFRRTLALALSVDAKVKCISPLYAESIGNLRFNDRVWFPSDGTGSVARIIHATLSPAFVSSSSFQSTKVFDSIHQELWPLGVRHPMGLITKLASNR